MGMACFYMVMSELFLWSCFVGHYLYTPSAGRGTKGSALAELVSEEITPNPANDGCLTFWSVLLLNQFQIPLPANSSRGNTVLHITHRITFSVNKKA